MQNISLLIPSLVVWIFNIFAFATFLGNRRLKKETLPDLVLLWLFVVLFFTIYIWVAFTGLEENQFWLIDIANFHETGWEVAATV